MRGPKQEALRHRADTEDHRCDFPNLGGDFACTVGSTLVQYRSEENPRLCFEEPERRPFAYARPHRIEIQAHCDGL